jgi:hypothetical protein
LDQQKLVRGVSLNQVTYWIRDQLNESSACFVTRSYIGTDRWCGIGAANEIYNYFQ